MPNNGIVDNDIKRLRLNTESRIILNKLRINCTSREIRIDCITSKFMILLLVLLLLILDTY